MNMADRVFENLTSKCLAICAEHFPSSSGYALRTTRLGGPIEGRTVTIVRGEFQAIVSLQRFCSSAGHRHQEIRLVATLHDAPPPIEPTPHRWALLGPAIGSTSFAIIGISAATSASAMTAAMFVIPVLVALRLGAMLWLASDFHAKAKRDALPSPRPALALPSANGHGAPSDEMRWQSALRTLTDQQNYVRMRIAEQPFRTMAPLPSLSAEVA